MTRSAYVKTFMIMGVLAGTTGCGGFKLKVDPARVPKGQTATVSVTLPKDTKTDADFTFEVTDGKECGEISPSSQKTAQGLAQVIFTPRATVATACPATITVTDQNGKNQSASVKVLPVADSVNIEASTALTIILIASFVIDRIVAALMFLLGAGKRPTPPADEQGRSNLQANKKREKLTYMLLAGMLGLALGYFGDVRILEGLGFSNNVPLNVVLTALILTAGSDSISALLKKMGVASISEPESKPLEVKGTLVLERSTLPKKDAAGQTATSSS